MHPTATVTFGTLLKQLRKRGGMTQRDLAAALGYSDSLISSLERGQRQPDMDAVVQHFVPALGLQDDPTLAARLVNCAAAMRGEKSPPILFATQPSQAGKSITTAEPAPGIPALPVELIGRQEIVHQLGNRLRGHSGRLLSLLGPPGVGKTTLALAVAAYVQRHYADGARFVALAAVSDPILMATTIVASVAPGDASNKPPQSRLVELLRRRSLLLVLDNLEQIEGAATLIATLLAECPGLTILATSRERLHLRAEQRFKVPPLDLDSAITLFVQRGQAVDDGFCLTQENRPTLAAICTRLDCLPLALELCAAQIEIFTPAQLLSQLQAHPLDLLIDGARDLPPQQRTLRIAIARSYELLSNEEQMLFRRLAVFVGAFDLAATEAIFPLRSSVSLLRALVSKSLIRTERSSSGQQCYLVLETLREFAREKLRKHHEDEQALQNHATYYYQVASHSALNTNQINTDQTVKGMLYQQMELTHTNFHAALRWLLDHLPSEGLQMAVALIDFWVARGFVVEGTYWLKSALQANPQTSLAHARVMLGIADLANVYVRFPERESYAQSALEICLQLGNESLLPLCYRQLGLTRYLEHKFAEAEHFFRQGWQIAQKGTPTPEGAELRSLLASARRNLGDTDDAVRSELAASVVDAQKTGDAVRIARSMANLGWFDMLRGDLQNAAPLAAQALQFARSSQDKHAIGMAEKYVGIVAFKAGNWDEAEHHLQAALQNHREILDDLGTYSLICHLAQLAEARQQFAQAKDYYQQALQGFTEPSYARSTMRCLTGLASIALSENDLPTFQQRLSEAQSLIKQVPPLLTPYDQGIYEETINRLTSQRQVRQLA